MPAGASGASYGDAVGQVGSPSPRSGVRVRVRAGIVGVGFGICQPANVSLGEGPGGCKRQVLCAKQLPSCQGKS